MRPRALLSLTVTGFLLMATTSTLVSSRRAAKVRAMPINDVDMRTVENGAHPGKFCYGGFCYGVRVIVDEHRITEIAITSNRKTRHARKAEAVVSRVVQYQTLTVDAVSGATTTSKALLKAIELALSK